VRRAQVSSASWLPGSRRRRPRSRSPGCWPGSRGSFRSTGTTKLHRLEENVGAAAVKLTPDDIGNIDSAVSEITVQGARYPEHLQQIVGR
jgi:hypothetical protein